MGALRQDAEGENKANCSYEASPYWEKWSLFEIAKSVSFGNFVQFSFLIHLRAKLTKKVKKLIFLYTLKIASQKLKMLICKNVQGEGGTKCTKMEIADFPTIKTDHC